MSINPLFNPFPGLRPFEAHENHLFFGREGQSDELLRRLRRTRFLAVVGTSGSGKSSLMRAGLLPALHGGFMAQTAATWHIALMRPGSDPLGNLAEAMSQLAPFQMQNELANYQAAMLRASLSRSSLGLIETCKQAPLPANENLLVVVDQFEELFRFKQEAQKIGHGEEAAAFVQLLLEAARQRDVAIYVLLTMRSDFLGDCAQFRDLPEAINDGQYLIPRMTREQRRAAITGPINVANGTITDRLVQRLLNDVGDNPDQLPILQHALMRTWDHWQAQSRDSEPLDLPHYETIGAMAEALSQHADEAYHELPDDRSKKIAEVIFKRLTEKGADNREVRRPTSLQELMEVAEASAEAVIAVVERFRQVGRSFLMPPAEHALAPQTTVDISHESLIRNWKRLIKWVEEETRSARIYTRLAEDAALYRKGETSLWREPQLGLALQWQEEQMPNASWAKRYFDNFNTTQHFLQESVLKRNEEASEKEHEQKEKLRRTRRFATTLSILFAFTLALALFSWQQRDEALHQRRSAIRNAYDAKIQADSANLAKLESQKLQLRGDSLRSIAEENATRAEEASDEAQRQKRFAEKNAQTAFEEKRKAELERDRTTQLRNSTIAIDLARKALRQQQIGNNILAGWLSLLAFKFDSLSGKQFQDEVYDAMRISLNNIDPNSGGPFLLTRDSDWVRSVAWHPYENLIASTGDMTPKLWILQPSGTYIQETPHEKLMSASFFENRIRAVAGSIISSASGIRERLFLHGMTRTLAFNSNGNFLVAGSGDGAIDLWRVSRKEAQDNQPIHKTIGSHNGGTWAVTFSSDGGMLASGGADKTVRLWKVEKESINLSHIMKMTGRIKSLAFERNTTVLAVSGESGSTVLWEWRSGKRIGLNDASIGEVSSLTFSLGGDTLVTGHKDGSIGLWLWKENINSPVLRVRYHEGPVNSIAFSLDGRMMASGSSDQSIRLWDMQHLTEVPPLALKGHELWVFSVAFNPSGNLLVSAGADNTIRIWFTKYEHLANMLHEKLGSEPNESEKEQLNKITGLNYDNLNFFQRSRTQF